MSIPLILLVHGDAGVGKTTLAHTAPKPLLVLDAEHGSRFVRSRKIKWEPTAEEPPEAGEWDTCVVPVRDFDTLSATYRWLNTGQHPFRSVALDSLTEIQRRCKDAIKASGKGQGAGDPEDMNERRWGILLDKMEGLVRSFRDLVEHPTRPLEAVVIVALTDESKGKFRPLVQGSLRTSLTGFFDVEGYLYVKADESGSSHRQLLVSPVDERYEAKDRTGVFGDVIRQPTVTEMIETVNAELGGSE